VRRKRRICRDLDLIFGSKLEQAVVPPIMRLWGYTRIADLHDEQHIKDAGADAIAFTFDLLTGEWTALTELTASPKSRRKKGTPSPVSLKHSPKGCETHLVREVRA